VSTIACGSSILDALDTGAIDAWISQARPISSLPVTWFGDRIAAYQQHYDFHSLLPLAMRALRLSLLLAMSRFRPGFAQSGAMNVVTLPPPTSINPTSTTPDAAAAATDGPTIAYPSGNPIINNIDTLVVQYSTPWQNVDLTVSCGTTDGDESAFSFTADQRKICGIRHEPSSDIAQFLQMALMI
jgi:hypothetical protein